MCSWCNIVGAVHGLCLQWHLPCPVVKGGLFVPTAKTACGKCRYYVTEQWVAKKLEVLVDVPEELDLEWLRARGPQPHEQLQPEEPQQPSSSQAPGLDALAAAAAGALPLSASPCPSAVPS